MTDKSSPLPSPDNTPGDQRPQQDGEDLVDLLSILINNKKSLLFTTFSFALLSVLYALSLASVYQTEVAFLKPPESFVPQMFLGSTEKESTETPFYTTTSQSLYYKFLTRVQSYEHQRRVFDSGHFFNKFSNEALEPDKLNNYFLNIHESIVLDHEPLVKKKDAVEQFQRPLYLAIKGTKPEAMSEFLNAISETAKKDIKKETLDRVKLMIHYKITSGKLECSVSK